MRLIDADAMRHRLLCQPPKNISINFALELVSTMPTVDAVEVVQCKDCKYWHNNDCKNDSHGYCPISEKDFCSHGERREDNG